MKASEASTGKQTYRKDHKDTKQATTNGSKSGKLQQESGVDTPSKAWDKSVLPIETVLAL